MLDSDGLVESLPNAYQAVIDAVPGEVRNGRFFTDAPGNVREQQTYLWEVFSRSSARSLNIWVVRKWDVRGAEAELAADRRSNDHAHDSLTSSGAVKVLPDVGDDAMYVAGRVHGVSDSRGDGVNYDIGGVFAAARFRNVIVEVAWRGADYRGGATVRGRGYRGVELPVASARAAAAAMIKAIVAKLSG